MACVTHGSVKHVVHVLKTVVHVQGIPLVAMVNASHGIMRTVASVPRIVVDVLCVEIMYASLEKIGVIVVRIVKGVEMVTVRAGMEKIAVLAPQIVVLVDPTTLVRMETI